MALVDGIIRSVLTVVRRQELKAFKLLHFTIHGYFKQYFIESCNPPNPDEKNLSVS